MEFKQKCRFLGVSKFHSFKKNKDYNKLDLHLSDNSIVSFFVTDDVANMVRFDLYSEVEVTFEVKFNKDGTSRIYVLDVSC